MKHEEAESNRLTDSPYNALQNKKKNKWGLCMFVKLKEVVLSGYRVVKVNLIKLSYNQVKVN